MNHKNTDDIIRINTSSAADIDVVVNYVIQSQGFIEKADYTKITGATDTDIDLPDDGDSLITSLYLKNIDGAVANTVSIYKRVAGATNYLIFSCALAAGESIIYTKERGWTVYTATGKQKVETGSGGGSVAWGDITGTLFDQTDLQAALDAKEDSITATTSADYYRGDKTFQTLNKAAVGLGNVDNTSDVNKPVSTAQAAADAAILASAESYADGLVVGLWDDRGNYDPTGTSDYPASGGSGTAGAILKGDVWTVSVAGTISGNAVNIGDTVRALVDTPGLTDANWAIGENNIGYVPENVASKDASGGYAGLTLLKINFKNALNTFTSFFTNSNTAARTYTFQDRDGTIADDTDITGAKARANHTGTQLAATISDFNSAALAAAPAETATTTGALINAAGAATPNDTDLVATAENAGLLKKITWANVKAFLKTYFDSLATILTNKTLTSATNIFATVTTITSSATPTPTGDSRENELYVTALAANAVIAAPTGSATNGNKLIMRFKDDGTPRTLGYNAIFRNIGVTPPIITTAGKTIYIAAKYNSADTKWDILAVGQEA
jgi:hypothetical protein